MFASARYLRGVESILVFTCMSDNCDILNLTGIRIEVVCDENRSVDLTGKDFLVPSIIDIRRGHIIQ